MILQILIDKINSVADKCKDTANLDPFYNSTAFALYEFPETLTNNSNNQLNNDITNLTSEELKSLNVLRIF